MAADLQPIDEAAFLEQLAGHEFAGRFSLQIAGGEIPVQVQRRDSPILIITFAGAINRSKLQLPQFGGTRLEAFTVGSVIGFADPSLARGPDLTAAWYAGHEGFETQSILPGLIQRCVAACGAERVIYAGGSVGGFAALYYSWLHPGSIVIATNPQTNIERYSAGHQEFYRRYCRPGLGESEPLSTVITSNVVPLYARVFENTVIYLQNAADPFHLRGHFAPFVAAIDLPHQEKMLARLGFWNQIGHTAMPTNEWLAWLKAAIDSPTINAADIQTTRREYVPPVRDPKAIAAARQRAEDIRLATLIADHARSLAAEATSRAGGEA